MSQPVLICNQSAQSTIKLVCKTCLVNLLKYEYHLSLSIRFVIIKTLHPPIRMNSTGSEQLKLNELELGTGSGETKKKEKAAGVGLERLGEGRWDWIGLILGPQKGNCQEIE